MCWCGMSYTVRCNVLTSRRHNVTNCLICTRSKVAKLKSEDDSRKARIDDRGWKEKLEMNHELAAGVFNGEEITI